ncbi:xanthine dehydrogenase accessory protein XdhC [Acetobacter sacchari]|uniref:Xanthine dehydrogenase accessory protein XdhC n=1 Tax=Acetobacter sacchari TaxID=2661687 RepID=A0ABS3LWU3_9PROT|nr:xanthine dehydrogenase accessory protein XdhC [Acetobacter sacchari]MBO1360366.1 xanthine dehydrogenase accessory protein XdhC [Acetobacter sacchari]
MDEKVEALRRWRDDGRPVACVTITRAQGSSPREAGAFMLVNADAASGTIGGGELEWRATCAAREALSCDVRTKTLSVPLGPEIGQCCGGRVDLRIERLDANGFAALERSLLQERAKRPTLILFGAGHVGRALASSLSALPLRLIWADSRPEEFGTIPQGVEIEDTGDWERIVADAPSGSGALVLTHSHALDALVVVALLERGDFAYVGMIGSTTKRRRFESSFREIGLPDERIATLICPIGDRGVRDKRPEVIAALVAAEIVERLLHARPLERTS